MTLSWSKVGSSDVDDDICSKFYSSLTRAWLIWDKCRRFYKWFSVLQLLIAYAFGVTGIILYRVGNYCCWGGTTSERGSKTGSSNNLEHKELENWQQSTVSESHPIKGWNYLLLNSFCNFIGFLFLFLGAITILLCYLVLFLSFVSCYEVRNDNVEALYYVLDLDWLKSGNTDFNKNSGLPLTVYSRMDRKPWCKSGNIHVNPSTILHGQNVYTGWIRLCVVDVPIEGRITDLEEQKLDPLWYEECSSGKQPLQPSGGQHQVDERWIYCNSPTGQMMFKSFQTCGDAQFYINLYSSTEQQSLNSEVSPFSNDSSVPISTAVPIIHVENTFITPSSVVLSSANK
jgi:hypothetical protein